MASIKNDIKNIESTYTSSSIPPNISADYESKISEYNNTLLPDHKSMVAKFNELLEEYQQEIKTYNELVEKYNSGAR